jgi:hypothetical protein
MRAPPLPGRAIPPRLLAIIFVLWLGTTGVLLWDMESENRLRGSVCGATR